MKFRPLRFLLLPLILWQCTTPPPPVSPKPPLPVVVPGPDDDHRSVSPQEFQASPWKPLPGLTGWKPLPGGAAVTLADGRELRLSFVAPAVVRWWVPSGPGEEPFSPAAVYPSDPGVVVKVKEEEGTLFIDTPGLSLRWRLSDLSWTLVRGDKSVLKTIGGPRRAGRRLNQAFDAADAAKWVGLGIDGVGSAKSWIDDSAQGSPFAVPVLFGAGGNLSLVAALDNSYQCYTQVTENEASLGVLNGGLDLLVGASAQPAGVLEALTALTGRPGVVPLWAHGTALGLPPTEKGTFLRKAKLSVQTSAGPFREDRATFQSLVSSPPNQLPDLTQSSTKAAWLAQLPWESLPKAAGISLPPAPGRQDWDTRFFDGGNNSLLARMNNRLPEIQARTVAQALSARNPGFRSLLLAGSGSLGTIRSALPELKVAVGDRTSLSRVLALGTAGLGTPAIRLDLTPLANPDTKKAAFQSLLSWLLIPVLTLDWGPDPAGFWAGLSEADQKRLKNILDRRSQFKPLFAQTFRQTAATGRPAWAPLWFSGTSDPQALARDDEFLLGESLLGAPVSGGADSRSVYLPGPGVWFDFWTGEELGGGRAYDVAAKLDKPLLFVRGGSLIPVREAESFDAKDVYNPLTLHVFPGGRGVGLYSLDDGVSLTGQGGAWEIQLTYDFSQKEMTLEHEALATTGQIRPDPYVLYRLHNVFRPKQVRIDGKPIPLFGDSWGITDTDRSAAWYESDHTLLLKTFRPEKEQTIQMSF